MPESLPGAGGGIVCISPLITARDIGHIVWFGVYRTMTEMIFGVSQTSAGQAMYQCGLDLLSLDWSSGLVP